MTQTEFIYRVTVISYSPTRGPDYLWANSHEIAAPVGLLGDEELSANVAQAFAVYHRSLLNPMFGVDRVVISTYGPDLPWPPGFAVFPARAGGLGPSGSPLPLSIVAFVRRNVQRGRDGKLFLRGLLTPVHVAGEAITSEIADYINTRGALLLSALENLNARMVLASGPAALIQTRTVLSLEAAGARTLQYRTRRKTRFQANAIDDLLRIVDGGGITVDELPTLISALQRLFPGRAWPQLPPPDGN